jgi:hypothetical protein
LKKRRWWFVGSHLQYIPAASVAWVEKMLQGIQDQKDGWGVSAHSLAVVLAINCAYSLSGRSPVITLSRNLLSTFKVSRQTTMINLRLLDKAGLVKLENNKGQSVRITLLHPPQKAGKKPIPATPSLLN